MKSTTFGSTIAAVMLLAGTMVACQNSPTTTTVPAHTHDTAPEHSHALLALGPYRVTGQELYDGKKLPPTVDGDRLVRVEVSLDRELWFSAPWSIYFSNTREAAQIDYSLQDSRITVSCRTFAANACHPQPDFHFRVYVSGSETPAT